MPRLIYRKDDGDESERAVIPLGYKFGERDKILCLDVSEASEKDVRKLEKLHIEYLEKIKEAGYYDKFRLFFMDNIVKVLSE